MRLNASFPSHGLVRFVGGVPNRIGQPIDAERIYEGEIVDKPMFSDGVTWLRIHVPGNPDDLLVPVDNLRP